MCWWQCFWPFRRRAANGCAPVGAVSAIARLVAAVATSAELLSVDAGGKDVCAVAVAAAVGNENVVVRICK